METIKAAGAMPASQIGKDSDLKQSPNTSGNLIVPSSFPSHHMADLVKSFFFLSFHLQKYQQCLSLIPIETENELRSETVVLTQQRSGETQVLLVY